jgi:hypothetical protein
MDREPDSTSTTSDKSSHSMKRPSGVFETAALWSLPLPAIDFLSDLTEYWCVSLGNLRSSNVNQMKMIFVALDDK